MKIKYNYDKKEFTEGTYIILKDEFKNAYSDLFAPDIATYITEIYEDQIYKRHTKRDLESTWTTLESTAEKWRFATKEEIEEAQKQGIIYDKELNQKIKKYG